MEKILKLTDPLCRVRVEHEEGKILASIDRMSYLPVTSFRTLNKVLEVEDVHAFDTGQYREWTRYYKEQQGCDIELLSGICYHLRNGEREFYLAEHLNQSHEGNQTPEIWLNPSDDKAINENVFNDTLLKVLTAIYKESGREVPDLTELAG